jgi:glutamine synthetase
MSHSYSPYSPKAATPNQEGTVANAPTPAPRETRPVSEYFGELTFGLGQMRERLPRDAYQDLVRALDNGKKIAPETADAVAKHVMDWAVKKGVTHFCHWFQPMTGLTAEKHDSFIAIQHTHHSELKVIERFTGSQLIQGEPDASSFPSGGMRSTFEARGYTAWDPTSPIFIVEGPTGNKTLCIPTVFFGYHGQALDNKTPLLRSVQSISSEVVSFLKLIGDLDVKSVMATLGAEQEYFLVDRELAAKRPDLLMCGRTVLGAGSARGQKLEDHYFGSIPTRVQAFMEELDRELWRLGIPVKTRHNEVAPSQFEMAPIFEGCSVAADHNTLTMETMKRVAARHNYTALLHEKPFAGINGSGKHCNWSLSTDRGDNLLDPGHTPHQNLRFLVMVALVVSAVRKHSDMLVASIMNAGNDLRLGGNEAPPTIISVFLGSQLEAIFESIAKGDVAKATDAQIINLGVAHLPDVAKDYTDRNRTSPFAFTGNKFEFRAVGASANTSVPVSILNAAAADAFADASVRLKKLLETHKNRDDAVLALIRELINESKGVLFSGNGYSQEWRDEAKRRGLPIFDTSSDAFAVWKDAKATEFLVSQKVLSRDEITARYVVNLERFAKTVEIELQTLGELVDEYVVPALETQLGRTYAVAEKARNEKLSESLGARVAKMESTLHELLTARTKLASALDKVHHIDDEAKKVDALAKDVQPLGVRVRQYADAAELLVADELWPLPKYREMLHSVTK